MFESFLTKFRVLFDHRFWLLLVIAIPAMFWLDPAITKAMLFNLLCMTMVLWFAHTARKVLFPSLDLSTDIDRAEMGNIAAGIVVFSVVLFYVAIVLGAILWLRW